MRNITTAFLLFFSILCIVLTRIAYADCNKLCISITEQCVSLNFASLVFSLFAFVFLGILIIEWDSEKEKWLGKRGGEIKWIGKLTQNIYLL